MTRHHILPSWRSKIKKYEYLLQAALKGSQTKNIRGGEGVLIIEGGHIGDMLMDASALYALVKHYQGLGKEVSFLCAQPLWDMLSRVYDMQGVHYVNTEHSYQLNHYENIDKILNQIGKKEFDIIIAIHNADSRIHCLVANLSADQKWGVISETDEKNLKEKLKHWVIDHCYTDIVWGDKRKFQMRYLESLLEKLHIQAHRTQNVFLPRNEDVQIPLDSPVAIAVDSANPIRGWETQKFIDLCHQLLKEYPKIYLIGVHMPQDMQDLLDDTLYLENGKIVNMVGKTSISEWIELIRGSRFLVGVDSGAIHVAAAVGTPAFCLTGVWDGYKCMPYDVDVVTQGTVLPICVYRQDTDVDRLPCFDCNSKGGPAACNAACAAQVKAGKGCLCLSKITPDDVMAAIHHAKEIGAIS